MPGTKRNPIRRPTVQQISARAVELYGALRRASRARRGAIDCTNAKSGYCTTKCRACQAWYDAHDVLHTELRLKPWEWPALPRCPFPPGSAAAREWHPGDAQRELQERLEAARRAAIN
jgi:hypothetical protein